MNSRKDSHRNIIGVFARYLFIHFEKITILFRDYFFAQSNNSFIVAFRHSSFSYFYSTVSFYSICKIKIDRHLRGADTVTCITSFFCSAGSHIPWNQVAECGVSSFQIIITICLRNFNASAFFIFIFRHPNSSIIPKALAHKRKFALMIATNGNACWMYLCKTWIGKPSSPFMRLPCGCYIASHCICA